MAHQRVSLFSSGSDRPTLPPLHTLNLKPRLAGVHDLHDSNETPTRTMRNWLHPRHASISSTSTSTSSRTPSPSPSDMSACSSSSSFSTSTALTTPSPSPPPEARVRLAPTTLDLAEVVFITHPPNAPHIPSLTGAPAPPKTMMLVGPALRTLRQASDRSFAKGARVHPYRIVRGASGGSRKPVAVVHAMPML
ncbi:hypothetical protein PLICRDRAFT_648523 [Plicaturopsis crispa FD-325 SS-3]|nr:hypothetical protein PLICRDRAFT_648523 [Plicaturopsis crispa FD-325 SS-3]